jgi:ATP-dependent Clp protease, protease subunit
LETYTKLLKERIVFLGQEIDEETANSIVAQLLYLEDEDPQKDIYLYINSSGGSVSSGMAIYDTMRHISPDISTICVGVAGGIAALLLAAGTKGKRFSLPNAQVILCQPMGSGQVSDIALQARELTYLVDVINSCFAENTSQSVNKIREDNENNLHMNSLEALEYGLIDRVIDSTPHNLPQE